MNLLITLPRYVVGQDLRRPCYGNAVGCCRVASVDHYGNSRVGLQVSCFSTTRRRGHIHMHTVEPVPNRNHVDGAVRILGGKRRDMSSVQQLSDQNICKGSHPKVSSRTL